MGRVWHPIYSNTGEVQCGYRPKKGINIASCCVNGYSITASPANSVTHVSFWWWEYRAKRNGRKYATQPIARATGSVLFSVRGYEVPSDPSEPSGTPGCFRWNLGLLLIRIVRRFLIQLIAVHYWALFSIQSTTNLMMSVLIRWSGSWIHIRFASRKLTESLATTSQSAASL